MIFAIIILLLLGIPIGITFFLLTYIYSLKNDINFNLLISSTYQSIDSYTLIAIPFFILTGLIVKEIGIIDKIINKISIGKKNPLFLGYLSILTSAFLGSITGSSVAVVTIIGSLMSNRMEIYGYKKGYTTALIAASGILGVMIPPSIPLIVYGAAVNKSISQLFIASLIPGILMVISYLFIHKFLYRRVIITPQNLSGIENSTSNSKSYYDIFVLILPVIILGGIYSGKFTPTEAGAIAILYSTIFGFFIKKINLSLINKLFSQSILLSSSILIVICLTSVFNKYIIIRRFPQQIADFSMNITDNPIVFLIILNILLIIVGMIMETNSAILLMAPLLLPTAINYGIDPIHFGIILVSNIELGLMTPPMAINLYVALKITKGNIKEVLPYTLIFFVHSLLVLILITFIPFLSVWYK